MTPRISLKWTITLAVVMIVLLVALIVGWIILTAREVIEGTGSPGLYWTLLAVGTVFLALVLVGTVLYLTLSIKAINLNQRQSNFIDSVTHELKSPIASLKLYLQTLNRRPVGQDQAADFYRFMLEDVERLDLLINHLLDAARLEHEEPPADQPLDVDLPALLAACAAAACVRYHVPRTAVQIACGPILIRGRQVDVDLVFRNLLDNAVKYAGSPPEVVVEARLAGDRAIVQIADNGRGIPQHMRRKIFGRFVRLGLELERDKPGTGLGLYIVRTVVKRMRGQINLRDRALGPGTTFEVDLPGRAAHAAGAAASGGENGADARAAPLAEPRADAKISS